MITIRGLLLLFFAAFIFNGCKKEFDHPPLQTLSDDDVLTIRQVIDLYQGEAIVVTDSLSVYATVTMDETDGNIYKNLYVQDTTGAINLRMTASADFFVGDSIRINMLGAVIDNYNGVMQISEIDPETKIIKQKQGQGISPKIVSISDLDFELVNQLVQIEDVQFVPGDLNGTYAFVAGQSSKNITLEDCYGNSVLLRTSGFANFAGDSIAKGKGSIVLIVDRFNNDLQVKIRSFAEVNMTGERCSGVILEDGAVLTKDFDDNSVTSGGWIVQQIVGTLTWETSTLGGAADPYAKISNYSGANFECESWLISPKIQLEGSTPTISFDNDVNYSGPQLQLLVSADYNGIGDPNNATWTDITSNVNWDSNPTGWGFENTGDIDLSAFVGQSVYIAYKYTGSNSDGSTWEVDEIVITG
jgi:hypothetical protein